jgi:predicted phage-related endonuclease
MGEGDMIGYPDEASWLAARKKKITSSDVPGLLGCYPSEQARQHKNPYEIWLKKTSEEDEEPSRELRRRFEAGHLFERLMHQWTEEELDICLFDPGDYCVVERGVLAATPDRYIVRDGGTVLWADGTLEGALAGLAEFKSDAIFNSRAWQESGKLDYAVVQLTTALYCADLTEGVIAVSFGMGLDFQTHAVTLAPDLVSLIVERAEEFMEYVLLGTPPPSKYLDDSAAIGASLRKIYAKETGATIALPPGEHEALLVEYQEITAQAAALEKRKRAIQNEVMLAMGDAAEATIAGAPKKWRWQTQARKGYTVEPGETRVLRLVNS